MGHCCKCYPRRATLHSVTIQVTAHDISSLLTASWPFQRAQQPNQRLFRLPQCWQVQYALAFIGTPSFIDASTLHSPLTSWPRRDVSQQQHCHGRAEHTSCAQHHARSCLAREAACGKALHSQQQLSGPRLRHSFSTSWGAMPESWPSPFALDSQFKWKSTTAFEAKGFICGQELG